MVTMAMAQDMDMAWDMDMVDTTDHGDMDTGEERRGLLTMKQLPLVPILMLTLMLMLTMATGVAMEDGDWDMDMVDTTDHGDMDTGEGSKRYSYLVALGTGTL